MKYDLDYEIKKYYKTLSTREFYDRFSDLELIQGYCKECPRYNTNYSCSPLDIDIEEFIVSYDYVDIEVTQLFFKKEDYERFYTKEEFDYVFKNTFLKERDIVVEKIKEREKSLEHANALTGPCNYCCKRCREEYDECQHPEIRRFSLASLGIYSGKLLKDLFDIDLIPLEKALPKYLTNLTAILYS